MLEDTQRVTLELSNRCNYAADHRLCPTSVSKGVRILPLSTIKSVVGELSELGWGRDKILCFHVFNEPGIDPRLFWLLRFIGGELPGIKISLATNGWYLDGTLARELFDFGLFRMTVTIYSKGELRRLKPEIASLPGVRIHIGRLKTTMLNPGDGPPGYRRCFAPLYDLTIRASGNVGLCCIDYDETVTFGNVCEESLIAILERRRSEMKGLHEELKRRIRNHAVCKTCWRRRPPIDPDRIIRKVNELRGKDGTSFT